MSLVRADKLGHKHIGKTIYVDISPVDLVGIRRVNSGWVELTVSECGHETKQTVAYNESIEVRD